MKLRNLIPSDKKQPSKKQRDKKHRGHQTSQNYKINWCHVVQNYVYAFYYSNWKNNPTISFKRFPRTMRLIWNKYKICNLYHMFAVNESNDSRIRARSYGNYKKILPWCILHQVFIVRQKYMFFFIYDVLQD